MKEQHVAYPFLIIVVSKIYLTMFRVATSLHTVISCFNLSIPAFSNLCQLVAVQNSGSIPAHQLQTFASGVHLITLKINSSGWVLLESGRLLIEISIS